MAPAGDPVGTGLISSLVRPGGNITGLSATSAETGALLQKYFEHLSAKHWFKIERRQTTWIQIDGSERYFLEGRIKEIARYCETDVVNT
jgi:hypothetical protein